MNRTAKASGISVIPAKMIRLMTSVIGASTRPLRLQAKMIRLMTSVIGAPTRPLRLQV
jgi:hypothetical protein